MKWFRAFCLATLMPASVAFASDDPLAAAGDFIKANCYDDARVELVKACRALPGQSDVAREGVAWLLLGVTDSSLGDLGAARSEIDEATAKFATANDSFGGWLSLMALSELERQNDDLPRALAAQERGLAVLDRAADPSAKFSFATMKILAPVLGLSLDALGPVMQFSDLVKPMFVRFMRIFALDNYGATLTEAGQLEKAEKQLQLAKEEATLFGGLLDGQLAPHVGDLRMRQWRLEEARESYLKALEGGPALRLVSQGDPQPELSILSRLAELDVLSGRVDEGLAWNDRALALVREMKNARRERGVLAKRADLLQTAGRYDESIALYETLLKGAIADADRSSEASIESDLGMIFMFQGQYGTSAKHLERSIEIYQSLHEPYLELGTWIFLAQVEMMVDAEDASAYALEKARELARKSDFKFGSMAVAVAIATQKAITGRAAAKDVDDALRPLLESPEAQNPKFHVVFANLSAMFHGVMGMPVTFEERMDVAVFRAVSLFFKGKLLLEQGDRKGARALWTQALGMSLNNEISAGLLTGIGLSHWQDGNRNEAIACLTKAAARIETTADDVRVEEMLAGYLGAPRHIYFDLLIEMLVKDGKWADAFAQTERARARAFLQMVGNRRLNAERGGDTRAVREAETLRSEIARRERQRGKGADDLARLRQRYQTLLTRVKVSNPEYESLTNVEPLRLEDVQRELPAEATLISYFGPYVWVIDRDEAHYEHLPLDPDALRRIRCWAQSVGSNSDARGARPVLECDESATAEDAYARLIAPIARHIRHSKLILVPHGVLHYVPFAALRNAGTHRYLIDDYTLTYAPSASALRFLRAKESAVNGSALVLGDPSTALPKLPGAEEEATAIAALLGTKPRLGKEARETLLRELHAKTDLVHLAAHGLYDPANPLYSRIALAGGGGDDGDLTVQDILSSVDLTGVNLVVLSACESAAGRRSEGDEVVGLTRALLYAGTPGVISSLWDIDDKASAGLMEEFYRRLVTGATVAESLRQAQLAVKERLPDPRYWAAFTLSGDPQGRWTHAAQ